MDKENKKILKTKRLSIYLSSIIKKITKTFK